MKILCVHQSSELYGSDRSFVQSLKAIRESNPNAQISVVMPTRGPLCRYVEPLCDRLIIEDVAVLARSDFRSPLGALRRLSRCSVRAIQMICRHDVVYVNTVVVFSYLIGSILTRKNIINHVREIPSDIEGVIFSAIFRLNRSRLIFNSRYTRNAYRFLSDKRCAIVHNGVQAVSKYQYHPLPESGNILLIGRINGWKGHDVALDAICRLKVAHPNVKLRIVGDAPPSQDYHLSGLKEQIRKRNLEAWVECHPFSNVPEVHYEWASIVLVPSTRPEPFGRVAIEALSLGRLVVASNHGGLSEILKDDFGGFLFVPGNSESLARKLELLLGDRPLMQRKSHDALVNFEQNFSEDIYFRRFKEVFGSFINE